MGGMGMGTHQTMGKTATLGNENGESQAKAPFFASRNHPESHNAVHMQHMNGGSGNGDPSDNGQNRHFGLRKWRIPSTNASFSFRNPPENHNACPHATHEWVKWEWGLIRQ